MWKKDSGFLNLTFRSGRASFRAALWWRAFFFFGVVFVALTAYQEHWAGLKRLALVLLFLGGLLLALVYSRALFRIPLLIPLVVWVTMTAASVMLFDTWSSQRLLRLDAIAILCGICFVWLTLYVVSYLKSHRIAHQIETAWIPAVMLILSALGGWLGLSALPLYSDAHAAQRTWEPEPPLVDRASRNGKRIGLALSGGGYRAAIFHAGVLNALERLQLQPDIISSVSGGSIIGAYYAAGGDPREFKAAVLDGRFNLKREAALIQNSVRLLFPLRVPYVGTRLAPWEFNRRDLQAEILEHVLFSQDAVTSDKQRVALILGTTDLTRGSIVGFAEGYGIIEVQAHDHASYYPKSMLWPTRGWTIPELVSISGAFPGAFPATRMELTGVDDFDNHVLTPLPMQLVDGGVLDNQGVKVLEALRGGCKCDGKVEPGGNVDCERRPLHSDVIFASDAGALLMDTTELDDVGGVLRALDVTSAPKGTLWGIPATVSISPRELIPIHTVGDQTYYFTKFTNSLRSREFPDAVRRELVSLAEKGREVEWAHQKIDAQKKVDLALQERLETFRSVATLDDQLTERQVDHLFSLGQILVYLKWPLMITDLQNTEPEPIDDYGTRFNGDSYRFADCSDSSEGDSASQYAQ